MSLSVWSMRRNDVGLNVGIVAKTNKISKVLRCTHRKINRKIRSVWIFNNISISCAHDNDDVKLITRVTIASLIREHTARDFRVKKEKLTITAAIVS